LKKTIVISIIFLTLLVGCGTSKRVFQNERIVNKGKSKKLALIAVSNKLLKQAFAIAKSGHPNDSTFVAVLKVN